MLWQVENDYFCAGIIVINNKIKIAAPILGWSEGKSFDYFKSYANRKKWKLIKVGEINGQSGKDA